MGRPPKRGLSYFPMDTDFLDDYKIMDLLEEHGPAGTMIYLTVVSEVYKAGYYLEVEPQKLATKIVRLIGGRWVKKGFVLQVLDTCAEYGLFEKHLLQQGIITSVGIQRRYEAVCVRNKVQKDKYWLLQKKENEEALLSAPIKTVSASEKAVSVTESQVSAENTPIKKNKINIYTHTKVSYGNFGHVRLTPEEYEQLNRDYDNAHQRIRHLDEYIERKKSYVSANHYLDLSTGWVGDALEEQKERRERFKKKNSPQQKKPGGNFHNFEQRQYDYDELLKEING